MSKKLPFDLVNMQEFRVDAHSSANDPIEIFVAYGSEDKKINKFGPIYHKNAPMLLHEAMAEIVRDAAEDMYCHHGWKTMLMDGLRPVEAQIAQAINPANAGWYEKKMLSTPGTGAHPKGMAIDMIATGHDEKLVDFGTDFDAVEEPEKSKRIYKGDGISAEAQENRLIQERAMQRAALKHGRLLAPLRSEWWHYQPPENPDDLWRVLESIARCVGAEFPDTMVGQKMTYAEFIENWNYLFQNHTAALREHLGKTEPPLEETVIYHGDFPFIWQVDLDPHGIRICNSQWYPLISIMLKQGVEKIKEIKVGNEEKRQVAYDLTTWPVVKKRMEEGYNRTAGMEHLSI